MGCFQTIAQTTSSGFEPSHPICKGICGASCSNCLFQFFVGTGGAMMTNCIEKHLKGRLKIA